MAAVAESLCLAMLLVGVFVIVSADHTITADPGQDATLTCGTPNNKNTDVVNWSRADLGEEYVLVYRDGHFVPDKQHPSFKNRVDLQDKEMKDGDVSVILKNVTAADEGTYECRVAWKEPNQERAHLKLLSIIYLRIVAPPGPSGGLTEGGVNRGRPGLIASLSVFVVLVVAVIVGFVISRRPNHQPPADLQPV